MFAVRTFFTPLPYDLYNAATVSGNLAHAGVALCMINSQRYFWMSNGGLVLVYFSNNQNSRNILIVLCAFLYFMAYTRYNSVAKYLPLINIVKSNCF